MLFRSKNDWYGYSGCKSNNPLICENENLTIIIDDMEVSFHDLNEGFETVLDLSRAKFMRL